MKISFLVVIITFIFAVELNGQKITFNALKGKWILIDSNFTKPKMTMTINFVNSEFMSCRLDEVLAPALSYRLKYENEKAYIIMLESDLIDEGYNFEKYDSTHIHAIKMQSDTLTISNFNSSLYSKSNPVEYRFVKAEKHF